MNDHEHTYSIQVTWTGNLGRGTSSYRAYARDHEIAAAGKPAILGSSDPAFRGDRTRYNPEDLLVASLSACHMLWYLHYASDAGIVVTAYADSPTGVGEVGRGGAGRFVKATLRPVVTLRPGADLAAAEAIHHRIHEVCFIARSVNFPVDYAPTFLWDKA